MEIGVQFYTLRDFCTNLDDFSETLKKVADMGYKNVQISGTCDYKAEWLKKELDKNGLKCVITHIPPKRLQNDLSEVIKDHSVFGCENIGLGYYRFDETNEEENYENFLKVYSGVGTAISESGKYFMYHNHDNEFQKHGDKIILDLLAENFAPEQMGFTLDTFWIQAGGGDPAYWLEKLSGRVPCIHLKDFAYGRKMSVLGEGNINFDRVFEKAEAAGTKYMLVEQDDCNGENPFDCLKRSYNYLKSRGF
ncbi:MAG: sugar phosphate isomerase/epimerase [bacterium]|nr:sugar phosphate isomerase/epimerase [bacterium]